MGEYFMVNNVKLLDRINLQKYISRCCWLIFVNQQILDF